ncbi:MAG: CvpA family protein [Dehalococcoidia bacterium]
MNWLDIVIIVILVVPMYLGFRRGLIGTVLPLVGIVLGIVVAGRGYGSIANWLSNWLESPAQAKIVAFILIFILFMIAITVVTKLVRGFLGLLLLGWIDKLGGLVFGLVMGGVVAGVLLSIVSKFFLSRVEATVADSALAAFLLDKFPFVLYLLPKEFDAVRQFFG